MEINARGSEKSLSFCCLKIDNVFCVSRLTREGSGSLLINIGNCISKYMPDSNNIKYYAQELKENTYNLTRMNLVMRGIRPDNIVTRNGDTLEEDWPFFDENDPVNTYNPLYVDSVVSNPPYSQAWDPSNKEHDPRYSLPSLDKSLMIIQLILLSRISCIIS